VHRSRLFASRMTMWHLPGATKNFDQNCLIHAIWKKLVQLDTSIWIQRVPTKDNISDLPSRSTRFMLICAWAFVSWALRAGRSISLCAVLRLRESIQCWISPS